MSMRTRFSPQSLLSSLLLRTRRIGACGSSFLHRRHCCYLIDCFAFSTLPSHITVSFVDSSPKSRKLLARRRRTMADVSMNISNLIGMETSRKMSCGFNGKLNGIEGKTPFLIGVSGGTASGKSTVCKRIMEKLGQVDMDHTERQVVCISQDSFYRDLTNAEKLKAEKGQYNFDHPDAFDNDLVLQTLQDILAGVKCEIPAYDYRTNSLIKDQITTIYPADVVLFEGILVFYFPRIRDLFHMKLFVDTDSDTRLARRVPRDIKERGRDLDYVLNQYMNFVKPAFEEFCLPTKKFADVIIPRGADNTVAIELIVQHIRDLLSNRGRVTMEVACGISRAEGVFKRPH